MGTIKEGYLLKRSQNKKIFYSVNYRQRWFQLTSKLLTFYENEPNEKGGKEKGHIIINTIKTIEPLTDLIEGHLFIFQIGYLENILFVDANSNQERQDWIDALREVCGGNNCLENYFHPGLYNFDFLRRTARFTCCNSIVHQSSGCTPVTWKFANRLKRSAHGRSSLGNSYRRQNNSTALKSLQSLDNICANRVVIALYPFQAIENEDLNLQKGERYEVLDDSKENWWKARDKFGNVGYIPSNYVRDKEMVGLQQYDWYVGDMSRQRAEALLRHEDKEGCFLIRDSTTASLYTLSVYTRIFSPLPNVKHYHVKQSPLGDYYLSDRHQLPSVPDLIEYHKHNSGGLCTRLRLGPSAPVGNGLGHDRWEIDPSELSLLEELGSGQFGVVRRGRLGRKAVAVKMMKEHAMSEDDFIEEAKVMTQLKHPNLVQLFGVCLKRRPIYIVTEFLEHGSLLTYLRRHSRALSAQPSLLLSMCLQVNWGMAYLEQHNCIHRDLAARNCLVGRGQLVKVADFGLARYVLDDQYTSSGGSRFPIKWASPEVLNYSRFSSKSDVWAFGVLIWEVYSLGEMPYGRLKNAEVVVRVQQGLILDIPTLANAELYSVMRSCWTMQPENRPSFCDLQQKLSDLNNSLGNKAVHQENGENVSTEPW